MPPFTEWFGTKLRECLSRQPSLVINIVGTDDISQLPHLVRVWQMLGGGERGRSTLPPPPAVLCTIQLQYFFFSENGNPAFLSIRASLCANFPPLLQQRVAEQHQNFRWTLKQVQRKAPLNPGYGIINIHSLFTVNSLSKMGSYFDFWLFYKERTLYPKMAEGPPPPVDDGLMVGNLISWLGWPLPDISALSLAST